MKTWKRQRKEEKKMVSNEEREAEDWCFICKDGGDLMLCDYKDCVKVYHPGCVGKKKSFIDTGKRWTCRKHSCSLCLDIPRFCCYCCPNSVCQHCISGSEFTVVRGKKGFCKYCLKLVLLAEENSEYGLDGEKIDFKDRDTFECLFKEYWEIIKGKEGLSLDDVYSADVDSIKIGESEEDIDLRTPNSDTDSTELQRSMGKRKAPKEQEYLGWGSKPLIDFLRSIGKDTTKQLSQYDLDSIIFAYIRDRNLFHPEKKRKVLCDDKLYSIFRKKSLDRMKIYGLLGAHISENLVLLDENTSEDENENKLEDKKKDTVIVGKKGTVSSDITSLENEVSPSVRQSCFASLVTDNIKLVYLRRSLLEELLKQPENSESKIQGSFVRVKNDPRDYLQRNSHQLLQVEGIRKISSINEMNGEILLQVSNIPRDIPIFMLSDVDFTEDECEDLRQNVTNGMLRKPTVVELQQKARDLHEDITKHRIERELVRLQKYIDRANEKGWRREYPFIVPKVIAEVLEDESGSVDSIEVDKQGNLE
ncbi:unnamed protein product [Prunus armeniaca]|uniref:Uncharacterized protein n=1 Tax=Prunus armeniaca TaxID=36596 RepID=A0A6J5TU40_PRUAR|nr:unnamed protein product [Prunus armeniaca]